ncbi:MAG: tRNA preQ1(34) S-adenosylmethionine ribosyltransferase-isomerase QueA [Alphaproteobacteria bacterium]|nr:tRNA preQ1(34) S-adenosylmethionine ribosyltransferase-isomerase QueA [Alphaproteobacteria bacterium]
MRVDDFDFDLPADRIALRPARPRDSARLLVRARGGDLEDRVVRDLPQILRPGDALVFNDTRVIAARLFGRRVRDGASARISVTLLKRRDAAAWSALARPAKRLRRGDVIAFGEEAGSLRAEVTGTGAAGEIALGFDRSGAALDEAIAAHGVMPLPPYIAGKRPEDALDQEDYQTVYAREPGSVAAPTAGLHFTPGLMEALAARGVGAHFVTLEVGAGTFLPVKSETLEGHRMHAEFGRVSAQTAEALNAVRSAGGRIVAVGTTSLRLLESAAQEDGRLRPFAGETDIFIAPGYRVRAVDGLMTNFHLPRSTLFMLVSALAGLDAMRAAYAHAIAAGYRFYSYGDASLLWVETGVSP